VSHDFSSETSVAKVEPDSLGCLMRPARLRRNNFDAIRLTAALTVLVAHSWPLTGRTHPPALAGIPIFTLAVYVFFAVSGYLIAVSWKNSRSIPGFLRRRVFRIFPALVLVVIVTTFVIGPVVTTLSTIEYFATAQTWTYLTNVTLLATYDLPGVFIDQPKSAVNGSLWTLGPEFACYLGILAIGLAVRLLPQRFRRHAPLITIVLIAIGLALLASFSPHKSPAATSAAAMTFFAIGVALSHAAPNKLLPLWPLMALIPGWFLISALVPESALPLAWVVLPYTVLALGLRSAPGISRAGRFGDFSYGIYLWGFPIQQVFFGLVPKAPLWLDIVVVAAVAGAIAIA
jgi:peptidoglycan/LPS O-acetylase OafA/YrhL